MLIDYHAHVNFSAFKNDADDVIKRSLNGGVFMILVGSQINTSRRAVAMAEKYENGVWAAVGLHPIHLEERAVDEEESHFVPRKEEFDSVAYRNLAQSKKVVAIGECGLDYYHISKETSVAEVKARQHEALRKHMDLASELDLPVILHCRGSAHDPEDAYQDILKIVQEYVRAGKLERRGAIHCFMSSLSVAQRFVELGFYVGFTGVITFPKTEKYADIIRALPAERILVETDCPYLAPVPYRGKRNEPFYVRYVAEKVAEIRGVPLHEMENILFENTLRVFSRMVLNVC
ncbi:MAG: Hydrolase, TatD family [Parcubacteria group bacterium GW2011_GWC2_45_7]|nr:MAG: Hydrolase, TatD family [Parcubacteria group bacterium GW2011_GWC2_45_7]KKU73718.1 MAG: Hydrolase, TatD family [Parcubacteria group bacterium GW2011_GWA2_47_26]